MTRHQGECNELFMRPLMDRLNKRDRGEGGDIRISGGEGWTVETRVSFMLCTHIYTLTQTDRRTYTPQALVQAWPER